MDQPAVKVTAYDKALLHPESASADHCAWGGPTCPSEPVYTVALLDDTYPHSTCVAHLPGAIDGLVRIAAEQRPDLSVVL